MKPLVIDPVEVEPIELEEARVHLRIEAFGSPLEHPDDNYVTALITASRMWCEEYLERALSTQTLQIAFDKFTAKIALPGAPIQSIEEITYLDTSGARQTVDPEIYELDMHRNQVTLLYGEVWPTALEYTNSVQIEYVAGYTIGVSPDLFPFPLPIKQAMLLIIGNLYENRQQDLLANTRLSLNSLPMGVYTLLQPYRLGMGL
jgi:uncharacterized phiE125 gp8 family phage protein